MDDILKRCLPTYRLAEKIGEGLYGSVHRITDGLKERAVKIVPLRVERSRDMDSPAAIDSRISQDFHVVKAYYEKIRGPGLVEIYDFFLVRAADGRAGADAWLVILMQLCRGNLLDFVIKHHPLRIDMALTLTRQLADVLARLAGCGATTFLLTDLKPSNLLLDDQGNLLVGDLGGLNRMGTGALSVDAQFTPNWSAPEFILAGGRPDLRAAIFSYGLVVYFMWEGRLPYENEIFTTRIQRMKIEGIAFSRPDIPEWVEALIRRCVAHDPLKRPVNFAAVQTLLEAGMRTGAGTSENRARTVAAGTAVTPIATPTDAGLHQIWIDPLSAIVFVRVPAGAFGEIDLDEFWIGRTPVTQGQYQRLMGINPAHFMKGDTYPVETVSFNDAIDFASRLTAKHHDRFRFRLPTEAEWEYAARGGGESSGPADFTDTVWHRENSGLTTHPVGLKPANALGIYDICGNVMEWCGRDRRAAEPRASGRVASIYEDGGRRQAGRGGCWNSAPGDCRPDFRRLFSQRRGYAVLGFRLVRQP